MNAGTLYEEYKAKMQKIADVRYAAAVLQWDQETYLPLKGAHMRGRQIASLTETAHEQFTDGKLGNLLQDLAASGALTDTERRNVELSLYDYEKNKRLPAAFVRRLSEATNRSFHAWIQARKENAFDNFEAPLADVIALKKQEADLLGYARHPYDALMNDYDRGLTVSKVDELFAALKPGLLTLTKRIAGRPQVADGFLYGHFDRDKQWALGMEILKRINFDFEAGRQDISEHPFTISFSSNDVRVTTRISEDDFANMLWSCIHEGGHALYEQGLPAEQYGLPLSEYCSLSIHESQSRLWENCIGRGQAFWQHNYALITDHFPEQFKDVAPRQFYRAINKVQPSLIRTDADELTYHLHVMIRYELEKQLIDGSLAIKEIPAAWNGLYRDYLGVTVPDDKQGCLQDVHWSHGSFGYFATYSIGSLYASQLYAAISAAYPSLEEEMSNGNLGSLHSWLQQHIYATGRYYTSDELCKNATGEVLNSNYFNEYATRKYTEIYELT